MSIKLKEALKTMSPRATERNNTEPTTKLSRIIGALQKEESVSRKDFGQIANILRTYHNEDPDLIGAMTVRIAEELSEQSPGFNRDRFLKAAGVNV